MVAQSKSHVQTPRSLQRWFLWGTVGLGLAIIVLATWLSGGGGRGNSSPTTAYESELTLRQIPFDGQAAFEWLERICALGPRPSGSTGMQRQQTLLTDHFQQLGATVERQTFTMRHPQSGQPVELANLIVRWHPDRSQRILLCAHYDTRPYPDRDPDPAKQRDAFLGANDGASGVALLCVLGQHMRQLEGSLGVDFALFDAEEFVFDDSRDEYFHGSTHFARQYADQPRDYTYRAGVLLDMVGDASLQIFQERFSAGWPDTRPVVQQIWQTAQRLGVREFIPRTRHWVRDDHLPLRNIGRIPTVDVIDFDYPYPGSRENYWHTTADVPENCSALSLAKVGWVIHQWLIQAARTPQ